MFGKPFKNHYLLLRHGDTTWTKTKRSYPWPDSSKVGLTIKAKNQIEAVAKKLRKEKIELIFASDLYRAKQTARIVAKELGLKINFDQRLRDSYIGKYHGLPLEIFYRDFSSNWKSRFSRKMGVPDGESWNDVRKRVVSVLKELEKEYRGKRILIVGHGDPLWLFEGVIKGMTDQQLLDEIFIEKRYIKKGEIRELI